MSDYRQGTGVYEYPRIIGRAVNQIGVCWSKHIIIGQLIIGYSLYLYSFPRVTSLLSHAHSGYMRYIISTLSTSFVEQLECLSPLG